MNLARWTWTLATVVLATTVVPGCSSGSNGSSASSSQTRDKTMTKLGSALLDVENSFYNDNVVGQPSGPVDTQTSCALSGTVHITGSVTESQLASGSTSTAQDLTLSMNNCGVSTASSELTFAGASSFTLKGTWVTDSNAMTTQETRTIAGTVSVSGKLYAADGTTIDATVNEHNCHFSLTYTFDNSSWSETGTVCGVKINQSGKL